MGVIVWLINKGTSSMFMRFLVFVFDVLPSNLLSRLFGMWASIAFPYPLQVFFNRAFCFFCRIDLSDCGKAHGDFKTVNALFTRQVDMKDRPVEEGFPSPCDGKQLQFSESYRGVAVQAKSLDYDLNTLCATKSADFSWYSTIYLSPKDYHRVHCPIDGEIIQATHVPGDLFPVNDIFLPFKEGIFSENERVVFQILNPEIQANLYLVMVGAYNVGSVVSEFFPDLKTNVSGKRRSVLKAPASAKISKGDELATFRLGSTVVLAFEKGFDSVYKLSLIHI